MIMDLGNLLQKLFKMWVLFSSCEVISEQYMIMCKTACFEWQNKRNCAIIVMKTNKSDDFVLILNEN